MAVKADLFMVLLLSGLHFVTNLEIKKISVISVTTVVGYTVSLPCDVTHSPGDSIYLVLWFNDNLTTPIYSYDVRPGLKGDLDHWADDQVLGNRATLDVSRSPALLNLSNVKESDGGFYKCRVDFRSDPTKNTRVNLHVIVPPSEAEILVGNRKVQSVVGPFQEGETVNLTCVAKGGKPAPKVIWYADNKIVDDEMDDPAEGPVLGGPSNTLTLWNLTRENLRQMLTCEAPNNNITDPKSAVVMIDMNLAPLSIHILAPSDTLSAGREYSIVCDLRGSRPPPTITWWKGLKRVQGASETTSSDGNVTTSTLKLIPQPSEDGTTIICRAENAATSSVLEEQFPLSVHFVPEATIELGSNLDPKNIKEGDDVYFECKIHAQPKAYKVSFMHNNRELQHNISAKIILSNQSLVLQEVSRLQAGLYTCHASNIEGDGVAAPINLDIKFAPVCAPDQLVTYGVAKDEDAEVSCHVQANPPSSDFKWTFNNTADTIDVPHGRYTSSDTRSVITYTPITELDYGTLLCWASNIIGMQQEPCLFHIVPAGKPDSPTNCSVGNQTSYSFTVTCRPGFDGGLKQVFLLQATGAGGNHILNFTNGEPIFRVRDATPGTTYQVRVWAANDKGSSPTQNLRAFTLKPNSDLHTNHMGPLDAEVREGNTPASEDGEETSLALDSPGLPALVSVVLGASAGVLIIVVILILLIRFRNRRPPPPPPPQRHSHSPPNKATSSSSPNIQIKSPVCARTKTPTALCPEHEMQVEGESDPEPDVIPQQGGHSALPTMPTHPATTHASHTAPMGVMHAPHLAHEVHGVHTIPQGIYRPEGSPPVTVLPASLPQAYYYPAHVPMHTFHQCNTVNDPRYAHLSLERGSLPPPPPSTVPATRPEGLVPTVYATLDHRKSSSRHVHEAHDDEATPETPLVSKRESSV